MAQDSEQQDDMMQEEPIMTNNDEAVMPDAETESQADAAEAEPSPSKKEERRRKTRLTLEQLTQSEDEDDIRLSAQSITSGKFLRNLFYDHVWFILFITILVIIYVGNRYACQQEQIEQSKLIEKLTDRHYKALGTSSELKERTRPSELMELLNDSSLSNSNSPLYSVMVEEEE